MRLKPSRIQVDIRYLFFKHTSRLTMDFPVAIWLWATGRWEQRLWSARADWCRFSIVGCEEREAWPMTGDPNHDFEPMPSVWFCMYIVWIGIAIWCDLKNERQRYRRIWSLTLPGWVSKAAVRIGGLERLMLWDVFASATKECSALHRIARLRHVHRTLSTPLSSEAFDIFWHSFQIVAPEMFELIAVNFQNTSFFWVGGSN